MRDRDEWRRPWTAADAGGGPATVASEPRLAPVGLGWDAAYDRVDGLDADPERRGTYGRTDAVRAPDPTTPPPRAVAPTARTRRPPSRAALVLTALLAGAAGAGLTLVLADVTAFGGGASDEPAATGAVPAATAPAPTAPAPPDLPSIDRTRDLIPQVAELVTPSVLRIDVRGGSLQGQGLGSGVIYRPDGYILTNHHVIDGAGEVSVTLANGDRLPAEIVGSDPLADLAVLRIDRTGLPTIRIRPDAEPLRVGETVVAIGSPFGLDATVTAGIVSALNRDLDIPSGGGTIPAVVQTDAAINPGNSGGALVDLEGRLVGINTAIVSRSGRNEGIGFAVSTPQVVSSAEQLIAQGFVRYPLLGIMGTDVSEEVAAAFGLPDRRGAVVQSVQDGSGAALAGLLPGDVIVAVDGRPLGTMSQLVAEVRRRVPGDVVRLGIVREGVRSEILVTLGERPRS
jgi:S1-C subfamily serine protease